MVATRTRQHATLLVAMIIALLLSSALVETRVARAAAADYVVVLRDGVSVQTHLKALKITPNRVYRSALSGYAARLNDTQYQRVLASADVTALVPDAAVASGKPMLIVPPPAEQPAQAPSFAVRRVGLLSSTTAKVDGVDDELGVDIAILDSGLDLDHPDLDVRGGVNCTTAKSFADDNGHGTLVAGFAAAIDNAIGRVGIAPGARLWSVKVLNKVGSGKISQILCGIDWVTANAATIDVANMSFAGVVKNASAGGCGFADHKRDADVVHQAICGAVDAGVTMVAGAGNDSEDAETRAPPSYEEVITVSAMADNDGQPGGLGPAFNCLPGEVDDTFATFSNFGADIDISAPGVCINSTLPNDNYGTNSGTSFSAPLVAGAAALYLVNNPGATPADVKTSLLAIAEPGPIVGDPDGFAEGILDVSEL